VDHMDRGGPPNTRYNRSKSGWIDTNIFQNWFETTFLKEVDGGGPCALIGDNLASHINERVLRPVFRNNAPWGTYKSPPPLSCHGGGGGG